MVSDNLHNLKSYTDAFEYCVHLTDQKSDLTGNTHVLFRANMHRRALSVIALWSSLFLPKLLHGNHN